MNEFDHRPDSSLGDALREALTAPDDPAFVRRIMDRVPQPIVGETWWDILEDWARPGIAAALAVAAATTVWLAGTQQPAETLIADESALTPAETLSAGTLVSSSMPEFRWQLVLGEERVNE